MNLRRSVFLLWVAVALGACSDHAANPEATTAAPSLATMSVERIVVPREMRFDGLVEAVHQSTVAAQTGGRIVELPYDVGDYVEQGAVIVRITATEQRARAQTLEASVAEARARLAEADLAYRRTREVYDKQVVARAQLDRAAADRDSARARHEAAQAQLVEAREGLGYTVIKAPYAGIVVSRQVQIGETVAPGTLLMTGVSLDQLRIAVDIPQRHIAPLRRHGKARIVLADGRSIDAGAIRIPPAADPATHSFRVLLALPPGDPGVAPGMLVKVAFVSGEDMRLMLPPQALVLRGEVTGAYVVDAQGRVSLRYLRLGTAAADGRLPVLAGLDAGERVAIDPAAAAAAYQRQQRRGEETAG